MVEDNTRKDPAWKYARLQNEKDINTFVCGFCSKVTKGGVYRMKQHLVGGYRNVLVCRKCPDHVKEEIKEYMSKKKVIKEQRNLVVDIGTENYGIEDEDEVVVSNSNKRAAPSDPTLKKPRQNGLMDVYFTPNPKTVAQSNKGKGKQTTISATYNKEMREHTIQKIAQWFYDVGIPFITCNYESFASMIEAIGRFGPGLKPPSYHELRVCLKELDATQDLMKSHKAEWVKVARAREPFYHFSASTSRTTSNVSCPSSSSSQSLTQSTPPRVNLDDSETEEEDTDGYKSNDGVNEDEDQFSDDEFDL